MPSRRYSGRRKRRRSSSRRRSSRHSAVLEHVPGDGLVAAVERPERLDEVRVGQEPHVEDEVGVVRDAELVAERDEGHPQGLARVLAAVGLDEPGAQLVHGERGGVDDAVGRLPEVGEGPSLRPDAVEDVALAGQGVSASRSRGSDAPGPRRTASRNSTSTRCPVSRRVCSVSSRCARYSPSRTSTPSAMLPDRATRLGAQLGERRDERRGQVVDAEVAQVLEGLEGVALARPERPVMTTMPTASGRAGAGDRHATGSMRPRPPSFRR